MENRRHCRNIIRSRCDRDRLCCCPDPKAETRRHGRSACGATASHEPSASKAHWYHFSFKYGCYLNQIRQKIGIVFGNPETTTGGNALKFYSSVRIEIRRAAQIKMGERIIGNRVKIKIVKNKVAAPFRTCEFDIMYNEGISLSGDLLDAGVELGVIAKSGNTYSFGEEKLGVGRENAKTTLRERPDLMKDIRKKCMDAWQTREDDQNGSTHGPADEEEAEHHRNNQVVAEAKRKRGNVFCID